MDGIRVHCEESEPRVIGRKNSSAERVFVDVSHFEIFVKSPLPARFDCHQVLLYQTISYQELRPRPSRRRWPAWTNCRKCNLSVFRFVFVSDCAEVNVKRPCCRAI